MKTFGEKTAYNFSNKKLKLDREKSVDETDPSSLVSLLPNELNLTVKKSISASVIVNDILGCSNEDPNETNFFNTSQLAAL